MIGSNHFTVQSRQSGKRASAYTESYPFETSTSGPSTTIITSPNGPQKLEIDSDVKRQAIWIRKKSQDLDPDTDDEESYVCFYKGKDSFESKANK